MSSDPSIESLFEGFQKQLKGKWEKYRDKAYNPNTKGESYEEALENLLEDYFGGTYNIRTRVALIDSELKCFDTLSSKENEFDVVASFKQAKPQIVLEEGGMIWVPYNGVAFVCEVKSKLNKSALEADLNKIGKLRRLGKERRFGVTVSSDTCVKRQLLCLVYDEKSIAIDTMLEKLEKEVDKWDLVLLVEDDLLFVNHNIPLFDVDEILIKDNGLLWFIATLTLSIPSPAAVTTIDSLLKMEKRTRDLDIEKFDL